MKNKNTTDRLPAFDWQTYYERTITFDDSHFIENGIPFIAPVAEVGQRARLMYEMMLPLLPLELSEDEIDALFDPSDAELDFGGVYDDEDLFRKAMEHMAMTVDYWETIFEHRPPLSQEEKKKLTDRLNELNLLDGRIIPDGEYDAYMDGMGE